MAAKSRLGKGLGALFPALPGEQTVNGVEHATANTNVTSPKDPVKTVTERPKTSAGSNVSRETTQTQPRIDKSVDSPAEQKKSAKTSVRMKRASIPTLGELAHPSDMFFGAGISVSRETSTDANAKAMSNKQGTSTSDATMARPDSKTTVGKAKSTATKESKANASSAKNDKPSEPELKPVQGGYLDELPVTDIMPNMHQPRTIFDQDELNELSASIKEVGILQPIVVRKRSDVSENQPRYELIMGERRWRATQLAGLTTIPAIIKTTADDDMLRDALLENLHRVALNPLEEAAAYQQMIDEFGLTQAGLSKAISKSRPQIANTLRLLNLPTTVQKRVAAGVLSAGHARALLALDDKDQMDHLATRIIGEGLSVRSTEEIVAMMNKVSNVPKKPKPSKTNPWAGSAIQQSLENRFDTKVSIKGTPKHGRIEIVFSSPEDMQRILALLNPGASDSNSSNSEAWI